MVRSVSKPQASHVAGDGAGGFVYHRGVVAFDDAVVVGKEKIGLGVVLRGGADGGANGAHIVAQMGGCLWWLRL